MKNNLVFTSTLKNIKESLKRFSSVFIFTIIIFFLYVYNTNYDKVNLWNLCICLFLGVFTSLFTNIYSEYKKKTSNTIKRNIISFIISIIITTVFYLLMQNLKSGYKDYVFLSIYGIITAICCFIIYLIYTEDNEKYLFSYLFKSLILSFFISFIIYIGLMICYSAFQLLILSGFNGINSMFYSGIAVFSFVVIFFNMFFSYLPKKNSELKISKIYKITLNYVMLPIYILLIFILYMYISKIIFTMNIPVGEINIFASLALLGFVFFYLGLKMENNKLIRLFNKYAVFLLTPIIITQLIFIAVRVNAYGLTPLRVLSVTLIIIGVLFLINSVIKSNIKYTFLIGGIIILIVTVSPFNIFNISNYSQKSILINVLKENDMYKNGEILKKEDNSISKKDREKIQSVYDYFNNSNGYKDEFIKNISEGNFKSIYGIDYIDFYNYDENENIRGYTYNIDLSKTALNINGYKKMYFYSDNSLIINNKDIKDMNGNKLYIDLKDYLIKIFEENKNKGEYDLSNKINMIYKPNKNTKIVFQNVVIDIENNKTINSYIDCYVFVK